MGTTLIQPVDEVEDVLEESDNPFVGLRAYEAEESYLFFGRGKQTTELLEKLNATRFIGVVGSSGCGKSSLIKAGLIPKLKAGFLTGERDQWMISSMRPSGNPLLFLAQSINEAINASSFFSNEVRQYTDYTPAIVKGIKEKGPQGILDLLIPLFEGSRANLLLLVDQFEELFTTKRSDTSEETLKNENINFVNILLSLARQKNLPIYVIITMRSDYIGNCNKFYGLPEVLNEGQYLVPRLNRQQLQEIIELPIKSYGQKISPRLLDQLLNDSDKDLDQLPVLQHCLMRTYKFSLDKPHGNVIEFEHYEAGGKLERALSNHANEIYNKLDDKQKKIAEIVFRSLTDVNADNDPIRRRQSLQQLIQVSESLPNVSDDDVIEVINRFRDIDCAFLSPFRGKINETTIIDISHESLMRQWDKLKAWMHDEQGSARKFKWLSESVANNREALRGIDLKDALDWKRKQQPNEAWAVRYATNFSEVERFLEKSKRKGRVYNAIVYSSVLAFAIFLLIIFNQQLIAAREKEKSAKLSLKLKEQGITAEREKLRLHQKEDKIQEEFKAEKVKQDLQKLRDEKVAAEKRAADELKLLALKQQTELSNAKAATNRAMLLASEQQKEIFRQQLVINQLQRQAFYLSSHIDNDLKDKVIDSLLGGKKAVVEEIDITKHINNTLLEAVNTAADAVGKFAEEPKEGFRMAKEVWNTHKNPLLNTIFLKNINQNLFYKQIINPSPENLLSNPSVVFSADKSSFGISDGNGTIFQGNYKGGNVSIDDSYKYSYSNEYTTADTSVTSYSSINNFNINNNDIVAVQTDGKLVKWTGNTKKQLGTIDSKKEFKQIQFSPDNHYLVTAPGNRSNSAEINDRSIKLWRVGQDSLYELQVLDSNTQVKQITFSPKSNQLFLLYNDGRFKIWKTGDKKAVFDTVRVYTANYSPVGENIILTYTSGYLNVVDYSGKQTFPRTRLLSNSAIFRPRSFSISPDWKKMICKVNEKIAVVQNANGDSLIKTTISSSRLIAHAFSENLQVTNAAFLDSNEIFTLSSDGKINLWRTYPMFGNLETAFTTIQVPDATIAEQITEGRMAFDKLINSTEESKLREAAEYFERAGVIRRGPFDTARNRLYFTYTKELYKKLLAIASDNHKYYYLDKLISINNQSVSGEENKDNTKTINMLKEDLGFLESIKTSNRLVTAELSRTYGRLGGELLKNEKYPEAIESVKKALVLYPANDYLYGDLAKSYFLSKQFDEALKIYNGFKGKMLADSSNSFTGLFLGEMAEMESANLIVPKEPELFLKAAQVRGMLLEDRIKQNEALREKQKANPVDLSLLDQLAADYSERAYFLLFTKNFEEAGKSASKGLALLKEDDNIGYTNLALAYLLNNEFDKAMKIYTSFKDKQIANDERSFKTGFLKDFDDLEDAGIISKKDQKLYEKVTQIRAMLNK